MSGDDIYYNIKYVHDSSLGMGPILCGREKKVQNDDACGSVSVARDR